MGFPQRFKLCLLAAGMAILISIPSGAQTPLRNEGPVGHDAGLSKTTGAAAGIPDPFFDAVRNGSLKKVKVCLDRGIDINVLNENGESALHVVKDPVLAEYLIRHGADVDLTEKYAGMTPLFFQEVKIARLLVAAGADVNARSNKGNTPLIWFAYGNYLEGVKYLLSAGADISAVNQDGHTALDIAREFGGPELVQYLRSAGAAGKRAN